MTLSSETRTRGSVAPGAAGKVRGRQFAGHVVKVEVEIDDGLAVVVETHPNQAPIEIGAQVHVTWHPRNAVVLAG